MSERIQSEIESQKGILMSRKRHTTDQIIAKLRQADVELGQGKRVPEICKLKQLVADLSLDKKMLQDVVQGKV